MKKNIRISIKLLSKKIKFNEKLLEIIRDENIPMNVYRTCELESLSKEDIVIVDKNYCLVNDLDELYKKTKYIIYLIDEEDYNLEYIKKLYKNNVYDIFHSSFIPEEIQRKLWGLVKLLREGNIDQILDIILDSIKDSIAITDENGVLEYVNKGFLQATGYALDEVIGKNQRIIKSDGHTDIFYRDLWDTISQGNIWHGDFINISKSGELLYENASIYPIALNSRKYLKIGHYITKKNFLENKVKLSMTLAKNVLGTSAPSSYKDAYIEFEYFVKYMNELGGDYIWFDQIDKRKYILVLVDVTGHDLSSTLILMTIINFIKEYRSEESLTKLAEHINEYLNDFNEKSDLMKLISGVFCVIDLENSQIQYINAGHPSGLLFENKTMSLVELKRNTLLLGIKYNLELEATVLPIGQATDLILYSDGLLEFYLEDYTKINHRAYKNMFYEGNHLKFLEIKEELMNKDDIKDDLSFAHIKL